MLTALPPSVKRLDHQWMPQAGMAVDSHYARAVTACDTGYVIFYSECILGVIIEVRLSEPHTACSSVALCFRYCM